MTGIIPLDKGENCTSFKAVATVRRILGEKKCGHTGTLDPMATGVLPVAVGKATRFIELFPDKKKSYVATFKTGLRTDTLDIWGKVLEETGKEASFEDISALLSDFTGRISQIPPMYSALKKDGVRLYELARRGETVERESRECEIFSLEAENLYGGETKLFVTCSEGTYIRTLISDIGDRLGTGAVMTSLRRTSACSVGISSCITLEKLNLHAENGTLSDIIIPVEKMLLTYPSVNVTKPQGIRFLNGGELSRNRINDKGINGFVRVYSEEKFIGIGELSEESENLMVKRVYSEG